MPIFFQYVSHLYIALWHMGVWCAAPLRRRGETGKLYQDLPDQRSAGGAMHKGLAAGIIIGPISAPWISHALVALLHAASRAVRRKVLGHEATWGGHDHDDRQVRDQSARSLTGLRQL